MMRDEYKVERLVVRFSDTLAGVRVAQSAGGYLTSVTD